MLVFMATLRRSVADDYFVGLFNPGEIPNPSMENWLKNKEPWETPASGTKRTSDVN